MRVTLLPQRILNDTDLLFLSKPGKYSRWLKWWPDWLPVVDPGGFLDRLLLWHFRIIKVAMAKYFIRSGAHVHSVCLCMFNFYRIHLNSFIGLGVYWPWIIMDPKARMSENMRKRKKKKTCTDFCAGWLKIKKKASIQYINFSLFWINVTTVLWGESNILHDEKRLLKVKTGTFLMFRKKDFILLVDAGKT